MGQTAGHSTVHQHGCQHPGGGLFFQACQNQGKPVRDQRDGSNLCHSALVEEEGHRSRMERQLLRRFLSGNLVGVMLKVAMDCKGDCWDSPAMPDILRLCRDRGKFKQLASRSDTKEADEAESSRAQALIMGGTI